MTQAASTEVDGSRQILVRTLRGAMRGILRKPEELRYHAAREAWSVTKRFASSSIRNVEIREIPAVQDSIVEGYIDDPNRVVLASLSRAIGAASFFEIGTNRGRTAWTIARNLPSCEVTTLDLAAPDAPVVLDLNDSDRSFLGGGWATGEAFHDTREAARITAVFGDSATFDFSPYAGAMDVVFIDGAHSYSYVHNDTRAALSMLRPGGLLIWDDYPAIPGVYRFLNEFAETHAQPLHHVVGTRLVFAGGSGLVHPLSGARRRDQGVA